MSCITSCMSTSAISPRLLNPYRAAKRAEYSVDDIERAHRVHKRAGRHIEQVIPMSQVDNGE